MWNGESSIMGYLIVWKVLEEMAADLRKNGVVVLSTIISDLKSAKTMIEILRADPCHGETLQKIEEYLGNIESQLVSEGQKLGAEYVEKWLKRLNEASREISEEDEEETRFVSGLPQRQNWIRVRPLAELSVEKLKALAEESDLKYSVQNDGCLLVYGESEQVKNFVKRVSTRYGVEAEKGR